MVIYRDQNSVHNKKGGRSCDEYPLLKPWTQEIAIGALNMSDFSKICTRYCLGAVEIE